MNESYKKLNLATYARIAEAYAQRDTRRIPDSKELEDARLKFKKMLTPGDRLLDFGCGAGRDSSFFSEQGFRVTGIDLSPQMLAQAHLVAPNCTLLKMDMEAIKLPTTSFEAVWANASILHVPKSKLHNVLEQILNVLVPGGLLFIKVKQGNGEGPTDETRFGQTIRRFYAFYALQEITDALQATGFTIIEHAETTGGKWLDFYARKPLI